MATIDYITNAPPRKLTLANTHIPDEKMTMKQAFVLVVLLLTLLIAPFVQAAEPLLISKAYWVDESGKATFQAAVDADFEPFEGSLSEGYKPFALWLKLRISGQESLEQLAIVVSPAFIRNIELYDPSGDTSDKPLLPLLSGRDARITPVNHIGINNGFIVPSGKSHRDVFLRITTTTTLTVDVDVKSLDDADYESQVTATTLSVYSAFLLAFLLWALVNWAVRRDLIYGLFSLRQFLSVCHLFVCFGPLRYFFSGLLSVSVIDHIYNVITLSLSCVAAVFNFKLVSEFGVPRWLQKIAWSTIVLSASSFLLLLAGMVQQALNLNSIFLIASLIASVMLAFSVNDADKKPYGRLAINSLRFGFSLMATVIVVPVLMYNKLLQFNTPFFHVLFLHALISTIIFFAILSIRARQKDLLAQKLLVQFEIKEVELKKESERRAEKEKFLSMLTHELRNPLSVIRLMTNEGTSSGNAVQKAVLEMTQIIERVEQSEKLEDESMQTLRTSVRLGTVLRDVAMEHSASSRLDIKAPIDIVVETDERLLRRIVGNLFDNAEKYSAEGSRIRVLLEGRSAGGVDGAQLSVLNEVGEAGTPDVEKLFTKYYRSKGAHRRPGSGLGLFLVASWARVLGGNVSYEQIDGASSSSSVRFSVWLPK
ncbi:ATP-binding protein [Aestuariivirga sp.]|uniref:ATP-binding protein n=1 Tax=Aestuariivirga sp. TaxID=2650926 RepID=UPI0037834F8E